MEFAHFYLNSPIAKYLTLIMPDATLTLAKINVSSMTGTLAQLIALTSFGNEFLETGSVPNEFYPGNSTFQFCNSVEFVAFKQAFFFTRFKEKTFTADPVEWFKKLKKDKCKKLSLFYQSSADQSTGPDHKLAGFVGGGGTWLIEAIYDKHSDFWANNWAVTNKEAADRKIWSVKYGATAWEQPTQNLQFDLATVKNEVGEALSNISNFAGRHQLDNWTSIFEKARKTLDADNPAVDFYHKDLIVAKNYSLAARQLLFAAGLAWVFGGMGSWNDLGFGTDEDNKLYDDLSAALYGAINTAVMAAVNISDDHNE